MPKEVRSSWLEHVIRSNQTPICKQLVLLQRLQIEVESRASLIHEDYVSSSLCANAAQTWDDLFAVTDKMLTISDNPATSSTLLAMQACTGSTSTETKCPTSFRKKRAMRQAE
eukprot:CAMPEP_0171113982 /NCGR_PEP_ID=MMETSP0766_2-20121228/84164_1 /TAXON_ID=439317 /ORGANISM="Gambierdiscus australes, Strain CAWD 149" /LENGTH=112 /DNA_ID=CAMNT_0011576239 /DNA_START=503 /DNA_END=842 /DNA_ORIENTATION=-